MQRWLVLVFGYLLTTTAGIAEELQGVANLSAIKTKMESAVAKHGGEAYRQLQQRGFRYKAEITGHRGGESRVKVVHYQQGDRIREEIEVLGKTDIEGFDGNTGWRKQGFLVTRLAKEENEERREDALHGFFVVPRLLEVSTIESGEEAKLPDGRKAFRVTFKLSGTDGSASNASLAGRVRCYLDTENRLIGQEYMQFDADTDKRRRIVEVYHDFREQGGVTIPREHRLYMDGIHGATLHLIEFEPGIKIEESLFQQPASEEPPIVKDKLPYKAPFRISNNSIYVQVSIDGSKPYWIILDTGAYTTLIDEKVAKEVGLKKIPGSEHVSALVYGLLPEYGAKTKSIKIGEAEIKDRIVSVADLSIMPLGDDKLDGQPVIGLIGREVISAFQVTLNFADRTIIFEPPDAPRPKGAVVPFDLWGDHILVTMRVSDKKDVRMIVDTGAAMNLMPPNFKMEAPIGTFMTLEEWYKRMGEFLNKDQYSFMTGDVLVMRLNSINVGDLRVEPVFAFQKLAEKARQDTALADSTRGLLGIPIMRHFKVTFNYFREEMVWQRLSDQERASDNAGYGIWWQKATKGLVIEWVMPLSDADLTGLKKGDRIIALDGAPVEKMSEDQLVNRLSYTQPGRKLRLTVERAGKRLDFSLIARTYEI